MTDAVTLPLTAASRDTLVRQGLRLNYVTIAYNSLEAVVSLIAGLVAGSVALVGFGVDSIIEVTASGAAQWRLRADVDPRRRERVERSRCASSDGAFWPWRRTSSVTALAFHRDGEWTTTEEG